MGGANSIIILSGSLFSRDVFVGYLVGVTGFFWSLPFERLMILPSASYSVYEVCKDAAGVAGNFYFYLSVNDYGVFWISQ